MSQHVIYRGFTRTELDHAYSPSSKVASLQPYLDRYATDSAAARAAHDPRRWSTLAYGPSPTQTIDLFRPSTDVPVPLLIFIHGGYWQALHKDDASFPATAITAAGYAYAAINYTLAPAATLDAIVEECREAVAYLATHGAKHGIAAGRMVVAGHSAGAHLAAMALITSWQTRGAPADCISGALLLGGVFDLEPIRLSYVNDALALDLPSVTRNSPMLQVPATSVQLAICWAEHDTDEFKRQSQELGQRWAIAGHPAALFEQPNVNHFDSLFDWYNPTSRLTQETRRLLDRAV